MTVAETLRARIAEAEACIAAVTDNNFARQVLTARRAALADALALLKQPGPVVTLDAPAPQPAGSPTVELISQAEIDRMYERGDPALDPDPEIPPAAASPAVRDRVAPSDPPAGSGHPSSAAPRVGANSRTPERDALIRALWPDRSVSLAEIARRYNALPGRPLAQTSMYYVAKTLGLTGRAAETRKAILTTPARGDAAPDDPLAGLIPDDLAEARRMIASNQHGAKDLARHFGWDEPRAIRIAAAIRDDLTRPELAA